MPVERLTEIGRSIFLACGATEENAAGVMRSLVDANLTGHDSHGVIRIPSYVADIKSGRLKPRASPELSSDSGATATVDGGRTFGQVGARFTASTARDRARQFGLAAVAMYNGHHTGRIGEWAELGAEDGLVTFVCCSTSGHTHLVAPYGGTSAALGTNPVAWGIPRPGGQPPILLDFATSMGAQGKLMVARAKKGPLPEGWIVDRDGNPSTNVEDFYAGGALLPAAGHKGYALSVIVEMLAVGLSGGDRPENHRASSLFVVCIDPSRFRPAAEYLESVERTVLRMKAVKPAPGFEEILVPGEFEARNRLERQREGVPLPEATWEAIEHAADDVGAPVG
ncbi:MAG: Ldh family oxidoreductase [Chloroflexi bacterium]|nr:Ldh family oxidoreductase [Chloroflexota bacterium]